MAKSTKFTFTPALAHDVASAIVTLTDHGGQVQNLRETLAKMFHGAPCTVLDDTAKTMLADQFRELYAARPTVKATSVKALVANATKVARCMPAILGMTAEDQGVYAGSWSTLCAFSTQVQKAEGDTAVAIAEYTSSKKKKANNFGMRAAMLMKQLLNLRNGKFWTPEQKGRLVAIAIEREVKLGSLGTSSVEREVKLGSLGTSSVEPAKKKSRKAA